MREHRHRRRRRTHVKLENHKRHTQPNDRTYITSRPFCAQRTPRTLFSPNSATSQRPHACSNRAPLCAIRRRLESAWKRRWLRENRAPASGRKSGAKKSARRHITSRIGRRKPKRRFAIERVCVLFVRSSVCVFVYVREREQGTRPRTAVEYSSSS